MHRHAIEVKRHSAADGAAMIRLTSLRYTTAKCRDRVYIPWDYELSMLRQAEAWVERNGFGIAATAETPDGYLLLVYEFKPISKRFAKRHQLPQ